MITEDQLEQISLQWFREGGYECLPGPAIAPGGDAEEREDYRQVLLNARLRTALHRINPHIPVEALEEQVVHLLGKPDSPVLMQNNRRFQRYLLDGMPVAYNTEEDKKHDHVQLIDFHRPDNNQFLVVNQFTVAGRQLRRPDLVVFINGLPIAVIELKNPAEAERLVSPLASCHG